MHLLCTLAAIASVDVASQHLEVRLDPATHRVHGITRIDTAEPGSLRFALHPGARVLAITVDDHPVEYDGDGEIDGLESGDRVFIEWMGTHEEDVASGERIGQIHNFSVRAHVGEDGVFLSDGSNWYPQPLDARGFPQLRPMTIDIEPIEEWVFVASGDPVDPAPGRTWKTPRAVDGMAVVGNRHEVFERTVDAGDDVVDIAVHLSAAQADKADWYLDASERYLKLYTPLLGSYPYRRFTVVENFFSSGFAFPGFTVLGPRVIGMAPRSLKPGYLDHELVHAWWGNGVYVDPEDGNWCEALTSFCTNYGRRALEDGPEAARSYRRGVLNKVSLDPGLDDAPLGTFGWRTGVNGASRFVGYEKGAFVIMMLQDVLDGDSPPGDFSESRVWTMLHELARSHMGQRIGWNEIQAAAEAVHPDRGRGWLDPFFDRWVRRHTVPMTTPELQADPPQSLEVERSADGAWVEIDPDCRYYRLLPRSQTSPTISATLGGGVTVSVDEDAPAGGDLTAWMAQTTPGDNRLLVGAAAIATAADRIARSKDPIAIESGSFTVDGRTWDGIDQSVLHTVHDPQQPGRYITVFHSNGPSGWNRLRLIWYYGKDTTVVWDGDQTVLRRVYEPESRLQSGMNKFED